MYDVVGDDDDDDDGGSGGDDVENISRVFCLHICYFCGCQASKSCPK